MWIITHQFPRIHARGDRTGQKERKTCPKLLGRIWCGGINVEKNERNNPSFGTAEANWSFQSSEAIPEGREWDCSWFIAQRDKLIVLGVGLLLPAPP